VKEDKPVLATLLWVLVGAIAAALLFLAHWPLFHDEANGDHNDAGYDIQN